MSYRAGPTALVVQQAKNGIEAVAIGYPIKIVNKLKFLCRLSRLVALALLVVNMYHYERVVFTRYSESSQILY